MLDLIEYTIRNPASSDCDENSPFVYRHTHESVVHLLPGLLKHISYRLDYLPQCCDLLWELGRDNNHNLNNNAIGILIEIASYNIDKPIIVQKIILEAVNRWIERPDAYDHLHSPLEILEPLLEKSGDSHRLEDHRKVVVTPFNVILIEPVQDIRKHTLKIIEESTYSDQTKTVVRAIESLGKGLRLKIPINRKGAQNLDIEQAQWVPERSEILEIIDKLAQRMVDPLIHLQIIKTLRWHALHDSSPTIKATAREIIDSIPKSFDLRLTQALTDSFYHEWLDDEEHLRRELEERMQHVSKLNKTLAEEFIEKYPDAVEGVKRLNSNLELIKSNNVKVNPVEFLFSISEINSEYAANACDFLIRTPNFDLVSYLDLLLFEIRKVNLSRGLTIAKQALKSKQMKICLAIARIYYKGWAKELSSDDIDIIKELLIYPNLEVRRIAIGSLLRIYQSNPQNAMTIINNIYIYNYVSLAAELFNIFNNRSGIPYDKLNDLQLEILLKELEPIKEIDDHHIREFLKYISKKSPRSLIQFLINRIEYEKRDADFKNWDDIRNWHKRYIAIPYQGLSEELANLHESAEYKDILRKIRDAMVRNDENLNLRFSDLFKEISFGFNQVSLDVLNEWINSGNEREIVAASELLRDAPSELVLEHFDFVANILDKAYKVGYDCYRKICGILFEATLRGGSTRAFGEPDPRDIHLRDQANKILNELMMGSPEYRFYNLLKEHAENSINRDLKKDEELLD